MSGVSNIYRLVRKIRIERKANLRQFVYRWSSPAIMTRSERVVR